MTEMVTHQGGGKAHRIDYDWTLLPMDSLIEIAKLMSKNVDSHGRENWRKLPVEEHIRHLSAHLAEFSTRAQSGQHTVEGMRYHLLRTAARALMALATYNSNVKCEDCEIEPEIKEFEMPMREPGEDKSE
jgi:hypothetical protein